MYFLMKIKIRSQKKLTEDANQLKHLFQNGHSSASF